MSALQRLLCMVTQRRVRGSAALLVFYRSVQSRQMVCTHFLSFPPLRVWLPVALLPPDVASLLTMPLVPFAAPPVPAVPVSSRSFPPFSADNAPFPNLTPPAGPIAVRSGSSSVSCLDNFNIPLVWVPVRRMICMVNGSPTPWICCWGCCWCCCGAFFDIVGAFGFAFAFGGWYERVVASPV